MVLSPDIVLPKLPAGLCSHCWWTHRHWKEPSKNMSWLEMSRQQRAPPQLSNDSGKGNSAQERHFVPGLGMWFGRESGKTEGTCRRYLGAEGASHHVPTMFNREHQAWWAAPGCAQPGRGELHCKVPGTIHKCPDLNFTGPVTLRFLRNLPMEGSDVLNCFTSHTPDG